MRKSTFGGARHGVQSVKAPWGEPIPKSTRARGSKPRGSSTRKPRPDPSLWSIAYKPNDPLAWPLENPAARADLPLISGMSQAKANFNNAAVNKAFQRGGYAG
jgi:hypothetical protein